MLLSENRVFTRIHHPENLHAHQGDQPQHHPVDDRADRRGRALGRRARRDDRSGEPAARRRRRSRATTTRRWPASACSRKCARARPKASTPTSSPASATRGWMRRARSARGPVVGIAEAAMRAASLLATGFSVVTTLKRTVRHRRAPGRQVRRATPLPARARLRDSGARAGQTRKATPTARILAECRAALARRRLRRDRARLRRHGRPVPAAAAMNSACR